MSLKKFNKDLSFGEDKENTLISILENEGWVVDKQSKTAVLDFMATNPEGEKCYIEVKSRKCASDKYPTTMIWLNKLKKAIEKWEKEQIKTYFFFQFTDSIYFIEALPEVKEFKRWDRGNFDKPAYYLYYNINKLDKWENYKKP